MKALHVLFLTHEPKEMGTYFRAYHLARQLSLQGHRVTLMAVSSSHMFRTSVEEHDSLKIILTPRFLHYNPVLTRLASCGGWGIADMYRRIQEGTSNEYDIVQTFDHYPNIAIPFYYLRKSRKAKLVSDWCDLIHLPGGLGDVLKYRLDRIYRVLGHGLRAYARLVEIDVRKKSDAVTVISDRLRDVAIGYGIAPERISVIQGGADTELIKPLPREESRGKLGLPLEARVIGFLGKAQFDLDILIKSLAIIKRGIPTVRLLVIGRNFYPWTKRLARDLKVLDSYLEIGHCPDDQLSLYLSAVDVAALPLKNNLFNQTRWPNKIGEYMAAGRPTVVSDVGDVARLVRENRTGLVADTDVQDFASKLERLLENQSLARELGENARETVCNKYSWAVLASKLEEIYYRTLDSAG